LAHVAGGGVALIAGATALALRKGGRQHRLAGQVFVGSMTVMAAFGAILGILGPQKLATGAGVLAFYFMASGWAAVRRKQRSIGWPETSGFLLAIGVTGLFISLGNFAATQPDGELGGQSAPRYYLHAGIAGFGALLDSTVILRGGVAGAQRVARHLCFALFVAATTFFPQQPDIFVGAPVSLLMIPSLTIMLVMLFWLARIPFAKQVGEKPTEIS
jgi:hypothetical protein